MLAGPRGPMSGGALDGEPGESSETLFVRRLWQRLEGCKCLIGLVLSEGASVLKSAGRFNCAHDDIELLEAAIFDGPANDRPNTRIRGLFERLDQGQGGFAFGQIIAQIFAELRGVRLVIEHVIDQLVRRSEMATEVGQCSLLARARSRDHGRHFSARFEEFRGLAVNHFEITLLRRIVVTRIHELQHFAFGDDIRRLRHDFHDALRTDRRHHLKRT